MSTDATEICERVTELSSNSFITKKLIWSKGFGGYGLYPGALIWSCCMLFFIGMASLPLIFDKVNIIDILLFR